MESLGGKYLATLYSSPSQQKLLVLSFVEIMGKFLKNSDIHNIGTIIMCQILTSVNIKTNFTNTIMKLFSIFHLPSKVYVKI